MIKDFIVKNKGKTVDILCIRKRENTRKGKVFHIEYLFCE